MNKKKSKEEDLVTREDMELFYEEVTEKLQQLEEYADQVKEDNDKLWDDVLELKSQVQLLEQKIQALMAWQRTDARQLPVKPLQSNMLPVVLLKWRDGGEEELEE